MADERIKSSGIKLMVAGEFYEDEKHREIITNWNCKFTVDAHGIYSR
jgi:hypothetical protein